MRRSVLGLMGWLALASGALSETSQTKSASETWAGWRGNGRGIAVDATLPTTWSEKENILWTASPPGWGDSSPVIVDGRLYLTAQKEDDTLLVEALDAADGKLLWEFDAGKDRLEAHRFHNMASPTPVADGEHVWALFGSGQLVCLTKDGQKVWARNLVKEFGPYAIKWGMGSSPVLDGDRLFIVCMQEHGPSYVAALDKLTGKELWKTPRKMPTKGETLDSYSTPILVDTPNGKQLVVSGADFITAYDPETGKQIWISGGLKIDNPYGRTIASPTESGGVIVACSAARENLGKCIAVQGNGQGDVTDTNILWTFERYTPDCPTPLVYDGYVYLTRDNGVASCLDLKTGKSMWRKRLDGSDFKASPTGGDGKVYYTAVDGTVTVLKAGPEGEVLAENQVDGTIFASPSFADGVLYLRAKERLYAIKAGPTEPDAK